MAVNSVSYRANLGSANTDRNPSPNIWHDCPWLEIAEGETPGVLFYEDFVSFPITPATTEGNWGSYAQFSSTGGTITAGTGQGGEAIFASDGDNEGASFRSLATPFKITRALKKLWFECRIKTSTIADTKHGFFVGLTDNTAFTATVPIAADGTLADLNLVGFHRLEGDGDYVDSRYRADGVTAVTVGADAQVLVADTYVKLGFVFEPNTDSHVFSTTNQNILSFYGNNLRLADRKQIPSAAGTDFPNDVAMGVAFAVLNATGSTPGNTTVDWIRCAQLL